MIRARTLISIAVALALVMALMPTVALAAEEGTSTGSFTLGNALPIVNTVALWDTAGTPAAATAMTPQMEYNVKVNVTDTNTLGTLQTVTVTIFYDLNGTYDAGDVPVAGNVQTAAILTWTNVEPDPNTWTIDGVSGGGSWSIVSGSCVEPTLGDSTGDFEFHFIPGAVATETDATSRWHIYAEAADGTGTDDNYQDNRTMNWYGEVTNVTGAVGFGSVALGSTNTVSTSAVSVTYIANGAYNEQVKAMTPWVGQTSATELTLNTDGTPGAAEFSLKADDDDTVADAVQVTAAYLTFDTGTITPEAGNIEADNHLWLSLGASGIPAEEYQGTIYYLIANGS